MPARSLPRRLLCARPRPKPGSLRESWCPAGRGLSWCRAPITLATTRYGSPARRRRPRPSHQPRGRRHRAPRRRARRANAQRGRPGYLERPPAPGRLTAMRPSRPRIEAIARAPASRLGKRRVVGAAATDPGRRARRSPVSGFWLVMRTSPSFRRLQRIRTEFIATCRTSCEHRDQRPAAEETLAAP